MDSKPLVSVILPMFNSERFIAQSIQSVLAQSYENFECIVIDDGSSDRSWEIAQEFQKKDPRIQLIRLEKNQGVAAASNIAIQSAQGKYIARMDADDISLENRFALQVRFLESHPDVGIVGTGMRCMEETGRLLAVPPVFRGDVAIRWHILFENPFFNPTIMFRKSVVDGCSLKYDTSAIYGDEDYDYVSRLIALTKGENLPDILVHYRLHPSSLTYRYAEERNNSVTNISCRAVEALLPGAPVSQEEIVDLQRAIKGTSAMDRRKRSQLLPIYLKLWDAFYAKHKQEPGIFALKRDVLAWAGRMILFPPFQENGLKALWLLNRTDWRWPFYLLSKLPYYLARRRI